MTKTVTCFYLFLFRLVSWVCSYCQISCSRMSVLKMTAHTTQRIKKYTLQSEKRWPLFSVLLGRAEMSCSTHPDVCPRKGSCSTFTWIHLKEATGGERGFPGGSVIKNPPAKQEVWVWSLVQEDPLEKKMATHSSILAWESHGQRSLMAVGHGVTKSWTRLSAWTRGGGGTDGRKVRN